MIFHELTGINVIFLYSNTMFKRMDTDGKSGLTPRQGTYLIGLVNFLASGISVFTVN